MVVGRLLSYWDGLFSGAMLNFQGVDIVALHPATEMVFFNGWCKQHLVLSGPSLTAKVETSDQKLGDH